MLDWCENIDHEVKSLDLQHISHDLEVKFLDFDCKNITYCMTLRSNPCSVLRMWYFGITQTEPLIVTLNGEGIQSTKIQNKIVLKLCLQQYKDGSVY